MEELKEWLKHDGANVGDGLNDSMEELKEWLKPYACRSEQMNDDSMEELKEWLKLLLVIMPSATR